MRKNLCTTILVVLLLSCFIESSSGQSMLGQNTWYLKERRSLSGPDFINGVPQRIQMKMAGPNTLVINRAMRDSKGSLYSWNEQLPTTGKISIKTTPSGRTVSSMLLPISDTNRLVVASHFSVIGKPRMKDYTQTDTFRTTKTGALVMIRKVTGSQNWLMKGTYESSSSADSSGVTFTRFKTWDELVGFAKTQHKFILLDCFTSWCAPCKQMDQETFTSPLVAKIINNRFVAAKMQMDSTLTYIRENRQLYLQAKKIERAYQIDAFPSQLFFDSTGYAVHKSVGFLTITDLIQVADDAVSPTKQFYTRVAKARNHQLSVAAYPQLVEDARSLNYQTLSDSLATVYMINKLSGKNQLTDSVIHFLNVHNNLISTTTKVYQLIKENRRALDSIGGGQISEGLLSAMLTREVLKPAIDHAILVKTRPNWTQLFNRLLIDLDELKAKQLLIATQAQWYKSVKNWTSYVKCIIAAVRLSQPNGKDDSAYYLLTLNNSAWEVFLYGNNRSDLKEAISWIDRVLLYKRDDFNSMDTKACLLYKSGQHKAGARLQQTVIRLCIKNGQKATGYIENLIKMKNRSTKWKEFN